MASSGGARWHVASGSGNIRSVRGAKRALVAAMLTCALPGGTALAHRFAHPKSLRLGVRDGRLLLAISFDVNPGRDALRTRALFDRDSDGRLEEAEQAKLRATLENQARLWLKTRLGTDPVDWRRREATGHRLDRPVSDDGTLGLSLLYEAPIGARDEISLTIEDKDRDASKHVPLTVDVGPGWRIERASQGEWHRAPRQLSRVALAKGRPLVLVLSRVPAPG